MSSTSRARTSYVDRVHFDAFPASAAAIRNLIQLFVVGMGAATLAGCAQSSVVTRNSELPAVSRKASLEYNQKTSLVRNKPATSPLALAPSDKNAAATQAASYGFASFYKEGTKTASGEKFDAYALTAAHRTLPFGTRLRVTNVATGRSVTVRVNDRGPFIAGRVVDVSYSAAETLGMVGGGVAKVKLDVVQ